MSYFNIGKPTFIENWDKNLLSNSITTISFPLTPEQAKSLLAHNASLLEDGNCPTETEKLGLFSIIEMIELGISQNDSISKNGFFIRLGSRSPKDSWIGIRSGFRCSSAYYGIKLLCDSERVCDDLYMAKAEGYQPYIHIREWHNIQPWQEFRCFYKDGVLLGISQYNYLKKIVYPEIHEFAEDIEFAIRKKSAEIVKYFPSSTIIADYIFNNGEALFLECNPFCEYTDPCAFEKNHDFSEFEFRYFESQEV